MTTSSRLSFVMELVASGIITAEEFFHMTEVMDTPLYKALYE